MKQELQRVETMGPQKNPGEKKQVWCIADGSGGRENEDEDEASLVGLKMGLTPFLICKTKARMQGSPSHLAGFRHLFKKTCYKGGN